VSPSTWSHLVSLCGLALALSAPFGGPRAAEDSSDDPEPPAKVRSTVVSGLKVGESPTPFNPLHVNGKQVGKKNCLV